MFYVNRSQFFGTIGTINVPDGGRCHGLVYAGISPGAKPGGSPGAGYICRFDW